MENNLESVVNKGSKMIYKLVITSSLYMFGVLSELIELGTEASKSNSVRYQSQ